jgi:hypothetical protein
MENSEQNDVFTNLISSFTLVNTPRQPSYPPDMIETESHIQPRPATPDPQEDENAREIDEAIELLRDPILTIIVQRALNTKAELIDGE